MKAICALIARFRALRLKLSMTRWQRGPKSLRRLLAFLASASSLEELCHHRDVDAIDVVTPEETHLEPVLMAIGAGKEVFVEKPLATDLNHCDRMIEAAEAACRIPMPGHILRFEIKYGILQQDIEAKRLGKIVSMCARRNRTSALLERYHRTHPALENCIHDIDLMLWFTGDRVRRVRGYERRVTGRKHPDTFWGILEFEGGARAWLKPSGCCLLKQASGSTTQCR